MRVRPLAGGTTRVAKDLGLIGDSIRGWVLSGPPVRLVVEGRTRGDPSDVGAVGRGACDAFSIGAVRIRRERRKASRWPFGDQVKSPAP
jgi:hypothetical protein